MTLPPPPAALPLRPRLYEVAEGDLLVRFYNPLHGGWDALRSIARAARRCHIRIVSP